MFKRPMAMACSLVLALAGLAGTASLAQASAQAVACRHVTGPFHEHNNEITNLGRASGTSPMGSWSPGWGILTGRSTSLGMPPK